MHMEFLQMCNRLDAAVLRFLCVCVVCRYAGVWDCVKQTWREGGIQSFYRGVTFSMLRAAPVASVVLPTFDLTNKWLVDIYESREVQRWSLS